MNDWSEDDWISRLFPAKLQVWPRLMRLDRPIGIWLLLLPCWCGIALTGQAGSNLKFFLLFGLGAIVMRGAGCIVNDILDRDLDAKVSRTANRPLASGRLSVLSALCFLAFLFSVGLVILSRFNLPTIILGFASTPLILLYPLMKRYTDWPQAWLGLTFNWGVLMGWTAITGKLAFPPFLLYIAGFFWTLAYDTIYAHQDRNDDALAGVRSTARLLKNKTVPALIIFFSLTLLLSMLAGHSAGIGYGFYLFIIAATGHALWQVMTLDINNPNDCLKKFRSNRDFGLIVLVAILVGNFFKS